MISVALAVASLAASEPSLTEMLTSYGSCVARRKPVESMAFVLAEPPGGSGGRVKAPMDRVCERAFLGNAEVTFTTDSYRDALAGALVAQGASPPAAAIPQVAAVQGKASVRTRWEHDRASIGECVARLDAPSARKWVMAAPGSREEQAARFPVAQAFTGCARRATSVRQFNPEIMRGPVALGYLKAIAATAQPVSGTPR